MEDFYANQNLNVESYDSFCDPAPREIVNDIAFYASAAVRTGGPVLELACGTARVARALASQGLDVVGLDVQAQGSQLRFPIAGTQGWGDQFQRAGTDRGAG